MRQGEHHIHGLTDTVYDSGNEGFQYYASTANPHHLPPTSVAMIGHQDQANHQYDLGDGSFDAVAGSLDGIFDFRHPSAGKLFLNPDTGEPPSRH